MGNKPWCCHHRWNGVIGDAGLREYLKPHMKQPLTSCSKLLRTIKQKPPPTASPCRGVIVSWQGPTWHWTKTQWARCRERRCGGFTARWEGGGADLCWHSVATQKVMQVNQKPGKVSQLVCVVLHQVWTLKQTCTGTTWNQRQSSTAGTRLERQAERLGWTLTLAQGLKSNYQGFAPQRRVYQKLRRWWWLCLTTGTTEINLLRAEDVFKCSSWWDPGQLVWWTRGVQNALKHRETHTNRPWLPVEERPRLWKMSTIDWSFWDTVNCLKEEMVITSVMWFLSWQTP